MPNHPTDLLEAYSLDLLSPDAAQEVAAHLATCAECRAEVAALDDALPLLAYAAPLQSPPPNLEDRLMARLGDLRRKESVQPATPATPPIVVQPRQASRPITPVPPAARRPPVWIGAVGAIAAILVVALVGTRLFAGSTTTLSLRDRLVNQARTALGNPNAQVDFLSATNQGPQGAIAVLATDPATNRGVLLVGRMPPLRSDQTYEFWLVHGPSDATVTSTPLGGFSVHDDGTGEFDFQTAALAQIRNAGISLERAGPPPTNPDSPMLMLLHV